MSDRFLDVLEVLFVSLIFTAVIFLVVISVVLIKYPEKAFEDSCECEIVRYVYE